MDGCNLTCGNKRAPVSGRREGEVCQLIVAGYRVAKEAMAVAEDVATNSVLKRQRKLRRLNVRSCRLRWPLPVQSGCSRRLLVIAARRLCERNGSLCHLIFMS
jgi:hypothetical protein